MKPTKQLILAFREAASRLRDVRNFRYNWSSTQNCTCGILAQCILGFKDGMEFRERYPFLGGYWADLAKSKAICSQTDLPILKMFDILLDAGLDIEDFAKIERFGLKPDGSYPKRHDVAEYFDKIANTLEQERKDSHETHKAVDSRIQRSCVPVA